jgi:hypothetical protein
MEKHETYLGIEPFGVLIDSSKELEELVSQARNLKQLPFLQKLEEVRNMALRAMVNAYEQSKTNSDYNVREENAKIVYERHPLSYALENKAGCCRYQGALFFVLGYEADLGDKHFIQQAPVDPVEKEKGSLRSVFNDLVEAGKLYHISIFKDSLKDISFDYSKRNPRVFESAIGFPWPKDNPSPLFDNWGNKHFSYHRTKNGLLIVSENLRHKIDIES